MFFGRTDKSSFTMSSTQSYLEIQVKFVHSFRVGGGSILNEIKYTRVRITNMINQFRATLHTRLRAHDHYKHFKHSHWWKRRSRFKFASHYARGTNGVCECKMDVKVYMESYMAWNGSC